MTPELEQKLFSKYPKLYQRPDTPKENLMYFGFECEDGWYDLIDQLSECIQGYIDCNNIEQVVVLQVKEKYARMCYYTGSIDTKAADLIWGMIWFAEFMSGNLCEICGDKGKVIGDYWLKCRCEKHAAY